MTDQHDYFKTICQISRAFGTTKDKSELLDLVAVSAVDAMKVKGALLFLADEEKDELVPVAWHGLSDKYVREGFTSPSKLVPVMEQDGHLYSYDVTADPRLEKHEAKKAEGLKSILVVPVMVQGRLIGGLCLYSGEPREFSPDDIDFAAALAEQGGMAIQQADLLRMMRSNTRLFLDLAANINSSLDVKKIFHILASEIVEVLKIKASSILVTNGNGETLKLVASYGLSEKYLDRGVLTVDAGVARTLEGGPVFIRDAATDERVEYKEGKKEEGIASILSVPIKTKEQVIGVLRLYTGIPREFTEDEMRMITALAQQGGVAIEKARLFEKINDNLQLLLDFAVSINSSLDMKKIFHILSAEVAEALKVKASSVLLMDDDHERLELVASYGLSEKYLDRGFLSLDRSVAETLEARPVYIRDATTDERVQYRESKKEEGIVSILSIPIKTKDGVIGALRLYTEAPREFTEDEVMLVSALAYIGGLAIQNASLYLMLKEDMNDLKEEIWFHRSWF